MSRHPDPSRSALADVVAALAEEFRGIHSTATIQRLVRGCGYQFADARVLDFIPLLVHRLARERLRALPYRPAARDGCLLRPSGKLRRTIVGDDGMARLRQLLVDQAGMPGSPVLVILALLLVGGALALASVGGRVAVVGIAIMEAAAVAGLLTWAGQSRPR